MAEANVRKLLRLYKLRDKYDAVILAVHACFTEKGFSCVGSGEQSASSEDIFSFGEALPPDWNQLDDVYTLQYSKTNLGPVFMFKALKLGDKLVIYLMEGDESKMSDTTLDVDMYTLAETEYTSVPRPVESLDSVLRHIDQLKTKLCKDVLDKFTPGATTASTQSQRQEQTTSDTNERQRERPSRLIDDDPLRLPPRRPPDVRNEWVPPIGPFGYGDGDRFPGHPGPGGMLMDPFRSGGLGPGANMGPPGQLPRGAVPPGARFDPFGPIPPTGTRADPRSGRFAGPDNDNLHPPGFGDMFM